MKRTNVTSLQQSKEFVTPTNLEAVNYGNNIGPDWSIGTGGIGGRTFGTMVSGPRFLIEKMVAPTSVDGKGYEDRGPALFGMRAAPILLLCPSQQHDQLA